VVARRGGLGRGLSSLIPSEHEIGPGDSVLQEVPISHIIPNRRQPRGHFDEAALASLTASIGELGVLQPILVRAIEGDQFELIAGERRWRAAKRAGLQTVPAVVRVVEDAGSLEQALVENLHRQDLNPLEEAGAYQQLIEDFGLTHDDLARRVGKSRSSVSNTLRLFQLPPSIQRLVAEGQLSAGHARGLLGTPDRAFQESLARKAVAESWSVRQVEDAIRLRSELESGKPTPADKAEPKAGGKLRPPGLLELEELLSERLSTRVKVSMGSKHGKVVIDFATLEDLERIYRAMSEPPEEDPGG
jgi:ParB family chromosome partitioning protein